MKKEPRRRGVSIAPMSGDYCDSQIHSGSFSKKGRTLQNDHDETATINIGLGCALISVCTLLTFWIKLAERPPTIGP